MNIRQVFVIDAEGKPLLPTHPARARKLLANGKATVKQMVPFTIQLAHAVENPVGELTVGIDDGAVTVGVAVVNEHTQEVVFGGEIALRQDVARLMEKRKNFRRSRRSRQPRYRQPRPHRKRGKGWLTPTICQKKESVVRVVTDLQRIMLITRAVVEQGRFDTSSLVAGRDLAGIDYQIPRYAGRDFRAKVLWRNHYTYQHCGTHEQLQAHHIVHQKDGGSDTPENGLTLCKDCHAALHRGEWELTQRGLAVTPCVGWMTAYWHESLAIPKSHVHDALAMVCRTYVPRSWGGSPT